MSGTCALMPENPLNLILQSIPHQYRRRRLNLPQEFLRADIAFELAGVEDEMDKDLYLAPYIGYDYN